MRTCSFIHASFITVWVILSWGCEESPTLQVDQAREALAEARKVGAAEIAPDLFGQAEAHFQRANDELQMQTEQFSLLRDYSEAKKQLDTTQAIALEAKTKSQAQVDRLAAQVQKERENEKEDVIRVITEAQASLKHAKQLLREAPSGKDVELVLQIMENDIHSAETTLAEIPREIKPKDYTMVKEKAGEVEIVTARVRDQILQAIKKAQGTLP